MQLFVEKIGNMCLQYIDEHLNSVLCTVFDFLEGSRGGLTPSLGLTNLEMEVILHPLHI